MILSLKLHQGFVLMARKLFRAVIFQLNGTGKTSLMIFLPMNCKHHGRKQWWKGKLSRIRYWGTNSSRTLHPLSEGTRASFPGEQRLTKHTAPHRLLHMDVYFNKNNSVNIQENVDFFTIFPVYFHRLFLVKIHPPEPPF